MSSPGAVACTHCGLVAPALVTEGEASFCCRGCAAAYSLLHELGLEAYYPLRERVAPDRMAAPLDTNPDAHPFAHLDDEERQCALGNEPGRAWLGVEGLHCAACVWVLEQLPSRVEGVHEVRVDLASARLQIRWDPTRVRLSALAGQLATLGYRVHTLDADRERAQQRARRTERWRLAIAGASAGNVMLFAIALYLADFGAEMSAEMRSLFEWSSLVAALPAVTFGALPFYRGALAGLRLRRLHMDLPISVGLVVAFVASVIALFGGSGHLYFDSATTLVFLLLIGRHVQSIGHRRSLSETGVLELLLPAMAERVNADGTRERLSTHRLEVGDRIHVAHRERLPVDGHVLEGRGFVDASSLTGESVPLPVEPGRTVHAGTVYEGEGVSVEANAIGRDTRVGQLARRIVDAAGTRPPLQRMVDRLTARFSGAVLLATFIAVGVWWWIDPARVVPVAISLLVISCPCALGLATPVVLAISRARAARQGLLVREASVLEELGEAQVVVFDKTGTLTRGQPEVRAAHVARAHRGLLAAAEAGDGHPLARAIARWCEDAGVTAMPTDKRELVPGRGVRVDCQGHRVRVGSPAWVESMDEAIAQHVARFVARAWTPVVLEVDGLVVGALGIGDSLRPEAAGIISELREAGLQPVIASGDDPRVVASVARELGVEEFHGAMGPEQKADLVASRPTWMIGDGVNDAPALRAARVGLAMGGGAEVALEVADATALEEGLEPARALWRGAQRARRAVRGNLAFALTYNVLFAGLALSGFVTPLVAAIIMPLSSISVVGRALWVRTFDAPARTPQHLPASERAHRLQEMPSAL